jgi:cytidylate kinase
VLVIAIDGPSGSGKSTVARAVAERLDLDHLDTGSMYRSVALAALREGIDPEEGDEVARLARRLRIEVGERVTIDGVDATEDIRGDDVTRAVSAVAAHPDVRRELVRRQREWATSRAGGVVEGRDIGTVVFPDARLKVFLTADPEERARRRTGEMEGADQSAVAADMERRDRHDATREDSPTTAADDAVVLDTTGMSVDEVVEEVLSRL